MTEQTNNGQPGPPSNIATKLVEASKLIGPIGKDGNNDWQHYRFQSEATIKAAVKHALEQCGLTIIPQFKIMSQRDIANNKGKLNHIVDVLGKFIITDGTNQLEGYMPGSGMDTGEKATAKACTSAQKYFYKQLFNISDQEPDPDTTNSNINQQNNSQTFENSNYTNSQNQPYGGYQ